jgi:hypothetical protein
LTGALTGAHAAQTAPVPDRLAPLSFLPHFDFHFGNFALE